MIKLNYIILIASLTILMQACGSPGVLPVNQNTQPTPSIEQAKKTTPRISLATSTPLPTPPPQFSAEKFNLVPYQFKPQLPASALKQVDGPIGITDWSHNGEKVIFGYKTAETRFDPTAKDSKILVEKDGLYFNAHKWIANADGSNPQKLTEWSGGFYLWSPDDNHLLYERKTGIIRESFWVVDLTTMTHTELAIPPDEIMEETHFYGDFFWLDNEHLFYPTYGPDKSRTLWRHNVKTNTLQVITVDETVGYPWRSLRLSPNRKYVIGRTETTFWLGKLTTVRDQMHLVYVKTLFTDTYGIPYWAPNSQKFAMTFIDIREQSLYIVDIDTLDTVKIDFPLAIMSVNWSPDSQMLILKTKPSGTSMITPMHVVNADGSGQRLFWQDGFVNYWKLSSDGQYLIWYQIDGPQEIFKMELK